MQSLHFWWGGHLVRCSLDAGPVSSGAPAIARSVSWRLRIDDEDQGPIGKFDPSEPIEDVIDRALRVAQRKFGPGLVNEPLGPNDIGEQYGDEFFVEHDGKKYFVVFALGPNTAMAVPLDWKPDHSVPQQQFWLARVYPPGRPDLARSTKVDPDIMKRRPTETELRAIVAKLFPQR